MVNDPFIISMETTYIFILVVLSILAITDLIVGVSNDAVNFLNSAIGSKAISFRNIMIIVSIGIFMGAVFSSGMMEVARKGIFVPSLFYFDEIMIIFLAVMVTDILLLDFFNTLGMPTSTTVSIVFELLGAAVVMALLKILVEGESQMYNLTEYINTEKATAIIVGILLSVFIAFLIGAIIQWISRVIFTFQYNNKMKVAGVIFGGLALSSIVYFVLYKGMKGTPYYVNFKDVLERNIVVVLTVITGLSLLFSFIYSQVLKRNILVVIVGCGTFGLALAFAGNDLVNFIGVPMAAYHSFQAWINSGVDPSQFSMSVLEQKVPAESLILIISGGIMVATLWLSKKAKTVTDTTINLSRQGAGTEKFKPNLASRVLVKYGVSLGDFITSSLPSSLIERINSRFVPLSRNSEEVTANEPAFDLIRASVNLVVAGILISIATSMKLPLSTTYVTFMVAMGTSLADRAWGLDSAVYRVAGVINVIGGWFLTAIIAFLVSGTLAMIIYFGGMIGIISLLVITVLILLRNFILHKSTASSNAKRARISSKNKSITQIINESAPGMAEILEGVHNQYNLLIRGLATKNEKELKKVKKQAEQLNLKIEDIRNELFYFIKGLDQQSMEGSKFYIELLVHLTDIGQSFELLINKSFKHVQNNHRALRFSQIKEFQEVNRGLQSGLTAFEEAIRNDDFDALNSVEEKLNQIVLAITQLIETQVSLTKSEGVSPKNTTLYFSLMLETRDLVQACSKLSALFKN